MRRPSITPTRLLTLALVALMPVALLAQDQQPPAGAKGANQKAGAKAGAKAGGNAAAKGRAAQDGGAAAGGQEQMVPMRDSVKLATSIYLPQGAGPWPAVLARTPYNKAGSANGAARYTRAGYAYIVQDQRGKYRSEGAFNPHENEIRDGYDTVEWVAVQPWCNGKVGMTGASALGIAANLAAASDPPHLVCAFVRVAPRSNFYEGRFVGGMFKEADTGNWMRNNGVSDDAITVYRNRAVLDDQWKDVDLIFHRHKIDIPIYNSGGWYDLFSYGSVTNYQYLQNWGREGALGNQKLVMNPGPHGGTLRAGNLQYPNGTTDSDELRWFEYWLKGVDNGIMREPPIKYYMMASAERGEASSKNGWRTADTWPPNGAQRKRVYLQPGLKLSPQAPKDSSAQTAYKFDPDNPVKTNGGLNLTIPAGPLDQRECGQRPDYLRFQTDVLTEDLVVAGKIDCELWAATDGPDTDFVVTLVDVYPSGYEALVLDTGLRTRFRNGRRPEDVKMMTPGKPEKLAIDLWNSAITFEKGHRLAVHVSSSNHPRFEVNPNNGAAPGDKSVPSRVATNTIYHDAEHPSAIVLTVLPE